MDRRGGNRHEDARRRATRQRIAYEAARLMATQGVQDSREATRRAARSLGESHEPAWPGHEEVLAQLRDYQRLFLADTQPAALLGKREAALEAMQFLAGFEPRLYGGVLDGSASAEAPVRLQVFAEDPEAFARFLADQGWPATAFDQRLQLQRDRAQAFLAWRFMAGGVPFEIVALPPAQLRQAPLGPDGRPMARASASALRALLADQREASGT
jgi:hypothetical protein